MHHIVAVDTIQQWTACKTISHHITTTN